MIPYLDTSSLVKLYIAEAHSELVQDWVEEAEAVATSRVAYPRGTERILTPPPPRRPDDRRDGPCLRVVGG